MTEDDGRTFLVVDEPRLYSIVDAAEYGTYTLTMASNSSSVRPVRLHLRHLYPRHLTPQASIAMKFINPLKILALSSAFVAMTLAIACGSTTDTPAPDQPDTGLRAILATTDLGVRPQPNLLPADHPQVAGHCP